MGSKEHSLAGFCAYNGGAIGGHISNDEKRCPQTGGHDQGAGKHETACHHTPILNSLLLSNAPSFTVVRSAYSCRHAVLRRVGCGSTMQNGTGKDLPPVYACIGSPLQSYEKEQEKLPSTDIKVYSCNTTTLVSNGEIYGPCDPGESVTGRLANERELAGETAHGNRKVPATSTSTYSGYDDNYNFVQKKYASQHQVKSADALCGDKCRQHDQSHFSKFSTKEQVQLQNLTERLQQPRPRPLQQRHRLLEQLNSGIENDAAVRGCEHSCCWKFSRSTTAVPTETRATSITAIELFNGLNRSRSISICGGQPTIGGLRLECYPEDKIFASSNGSSNNSVTTTDELHHEVNGYWTSDSRSLAEGEGGGEDNRDVSDTCGKGSRNSLGHANVDAPPSVAFKPTSATTSSPCSHQKTLKPKGPPSPAKRILQTSTKLDYSNADQNPPPPHPRLQRSRRNQKLPSRPILSYFEPHPADDANLRALLQTVSTILLQDTIPRQSPPLLKSMFVSMSAPPLSPTSTNSTDSNPQTSNVWWNQLQAICREERKPLRSYYRSEQRGGRTAWSGVVKVEEMDIPGRYWFKHDFHFNGLEDAAEHAIKTIWPQRHYELLQSRLMPLSPTKNMLQQP